MMTIRQIAKICGDQDGAIWNNLVFRFNSRGRCRVYDLETLKTGNPEVEAEALDEFYLDRADEICPHCNAVMFGNEYFAEGDEFPLLYSNIYNNYAKSENQLKGVCLVYRLQRNDNRFFTTLVQMLEIGFVENTEHWKSENVEDFRPFGNFTIDREKSILYAFNMRDEVRKTRYFAFDLPKVNEGETDPKYGIKKVVLEAEDIKEYFDCEYHVCIQGACCHRGKIYSSEGFSSTIGKPPVLRVINPETQTQELKIEFNDFGIDTEAEVVDFWDDVCYYSDAHGNFYTIEF